MTATINPYPNYLHWCSEKYELFLEEKKYFKSNESFVYMGKSKLTGRNVAIKMIRRDPKVLNELNNLTKAQTEPGVIEIVEVVQTENYFYLITACPDNGIDLFEYRSKKGVLNEVEVRYIMKQVVTTLNGLLKTHRIIHGDLKGENIVIDISTKMAKLIDFGASYVDNEDGNERIFNIFGRTEYFLPPEWFRENFICGQSASVWALGLIMFDLLSQFVPFEEINVWKFIMKSGAQFISTEFLECSEGLKHLISDCINFDPNKRPSFEKILRRLS